MHQALHFNLKFLAEEVFESREYLQVPHSAGRDSWDFNVEAQRSHAAVLVVSLLLHGYEGHASGPRVLELVDPVDGREDAGLPIRVHQCDRQFAIKLCCRVLKVSLLSYPKAWTCDKLVRMMMCLPPARCASKNGRMIENAKKKNQTKAMQEKQLTLYCFS